MANNYEINYEDDRFKDVEADEKAALNEVEETYGGMIDESDKYYQDLIAESEKWADKQVELQNEQTDFAIKEIEQQKAQAEKDYLKEQSGAYVDWQKQSSKHGVNAEKMAASGMANTGYSESSQVSMYNTYQNRVATARESYQLAKQNYDNGITQARLQNNAAIAEIYAKAYEEQLTLALEGFQYKNALMTEKLNQRQNVQNTYYQRWQDVLNQINTENALAEEVRQYNASLAEEQRQYNESLALEKDKLAEEIRQYNETMAYQKAQDEIENAYRFTGSSGSSSTKSSGSKKTTKNNTKSKGTSGANAGLIKSGQATQHSTYDEVKVDKESVEKLGYGSISGTELAKLVKQGKAVVYTKGNKLVAAKSPAAKVASKYLGL